jgi:murein DD-endopeptidase MepM/ murein hydrolase activator NlpD
MIYSGKYKVTSPFGMRVLNGVTEDHRGIDVVSLGSKYICAVRPGVVAVSKMVKDKTDRTWEWGNYVCVLGDDGNYYYYCHMTQRLVEAGRRVKVGDHLGVEGNTGYSFGNHCHFEVRNGANVSVDPAPFLGIKNAVGVYGVDYRAEAKERFGLSEDTMRYLDRYKYSSDLYRKLVDNK